MRSALILAFYLSDELLSLISPFSSGSFVIALLIICIHRVVLSWGALLIIFIASTVAVSAGLTGAFLSGTPVSIFFLATTVALTVIWIIGVGLRAEDSILITPKGALVAVLISSGFLLLSILGWDAFSFIQGAPTSRSAGLYTEPSHYALYVMPLWLIAYQHRPYRLWLYAALALAVSWCFSTTLLVFVIFALTVQLYLTTAQESQSISKYGYRIIIVAMLLVLANGISNILTINGVPLQAYVESRLYGLVNSDDADAYNLSSLVVLQGIELAKLSFLQSFGIGVGLGNFGVNDQLNDQSVYRTLINTILGGADLSLRDGGLLANKLVGELGLMALAIPLMLLFYFLRLKATRDGRQLIYHSAWAVTLFCLLFIRALPYFSAPACLAVFSMAGVLATRAKSAARQPIKLPPSAVKES